MSYIKSMLMLLCWLFISMFFTHWWISNPEQFPQLPHSMWERIDKLYQSTNPENVAHLEFLVCFSISAVLVGLAFIACRCLLFRFSGKGL